MRGAAAGCLRMRAAIQCEEVMDRRGLVARGMLRRVPLPEVSDRLPDPYLHGLAQGDFDLALRGLLGEKALLSASTIARLKEKWGAEYRAWSTRRLDQLEVVYL